MSCHCKPGKICTCPPCADTHASKHRKTVEKAEKKAIKRKRK